MSVHAVVITCLAPPPLRPYSCELSCVGHFLSFFSWESWLRPSVYSYWLRRKELGAESSAKVSAISVKWPCFLVKIKKKKKISKNADFSFWVEEISQPLERTFLYCTIFPFLEHCGSLFFYKIICFFSQSQTWYWNLRVQTKPVCTYWVKNPL